MSVKVDESGNEERRLEAFASALGLLLGFGLPGSKDEEPDRHPDSWEERQRVRVRGTRPI